MLKINDIALWLIEEARKRLNVSLVSVMMLKEDEKELIIISSFGLPKNIINRTRMGIGEGIAGYVAKTGEPLLIKNIEKDLRFMRKSKTRYWTKSLISCPIKQNNTLFGVLNVNNKVDKSNFTENDLKEALKLADEAAIKFFFVKLEDLKKKTKEFETLLSFSRNIMASSYISHIIKHTQDVLLKLLSPEIILITIIPQKKIYLATEREIKEKRLKEFLISKISLFAPILPDISSFELERARLNIKPSKMPISSILKRSISLPLIIEDCEFGLLSIGRGFPFSREDLKFFTIILNYLTLALNKLLLYQNLSDSLKPNFTKNFI